MSAKQEYFETPGHAIAASIVVPVVDLLALAIRFHIRRTLNHGLKADDWLILVATVLTLGMGITLIYGVARKSIAYRFEVPQDLEDDPFAAATPQAALTGKIWRLNLSRRKKIAILLIFSLGAVSVAASLTRLIFTAKIVQKGFDPNDDPICNYCPKPPVIIKIRTNSKIKVVITNGLYWGVVECSVGILVADLPTLQFVVRIPAWESLMSSGKSLWDITSSKAQLLKSKASQISLRRDPDRPSADLQTPKNDNISVHSAGRQGKVSKEAILGIEMSKLNRSD
ncbi:hypothetical protein CHU98_g9196 [Xylaria longipes]|nr:hypothetical protein CHU98_g9196 [Xylaria longipes]